ncbi:MAG TPA: hypothetical protein VJ824_04825 [Bacillota bacterium]|nr:hypothetical protein [Bacillota bacterium]
MTDKADKKRRKKLQEMKKQRESIKKAAKRGKVVSKLSKGKFIIPMVNGRPITRGQKNTEQQVEPK